jgi:hypothetical protein
MRDALIAAELVTLKQRLASGGRAARVVLFYRYFDAKLHPAVRVDSAEGADRALEDVLGTLREGDTNIQAALLASLEHVEEARKVDPDLAKAQIVLVTDGKAPVHAAEIEIARRRLGDLAVGLSVVALGEENESLRQLVAKQRARGERAFYHFIPDAALADLAEGNLGEHGPVHPPVVASEATDLGAELEATLEELFALARGREVDALERLGDEHAARRELGTDDAAAPDAERARAWALYRDHRSLQLQFDRWFPNAAPVSPDMYAAPNDVDATVVMLATLVDVIDVTRGTPLQRQADAIELLDRLLPDAGLTPARYTAVVKAAPPSVATALEELRKLTSARPPKGAT